MQVAILAQVPLRARDIIDEVTKSQS